MNLLRIATVAGLATLAGGQPIAIERQRTSYGAPHTEARTKRRAKRKGEVAPQHVHKREIARRLRQAARNAYRQAERYERAWILQVQDPDVVGLSRRFLFVRKGA